MNEVWTIVGRHDTEVAILGVYSTKEKAVAGVEAYIAEDNIDCDRSEETPTRIVWNLKFQHSKSFIVAERCEVDA